MIKELVLRKGVIGVVLYNKYLNYAWNPGSPKDLVTIETVADVIDYVVQLVGNTKHVAIGSDFDGGYGADSIPYGMDSIADLKKISEVLVNRGYSSRDVENIMYGNWLRVLRESLP
jgi:membrane dipeptidase